MRKQVITSMSLYTLNEAEEIYNCIKRGLHNKVTLALHEMKSEIDLIDVLHPPLSGNSNNSRVEICSIFRGPLVALSEEEEYLRGKYMAKTYLYRERVGKISDFPGIKNWEITNDRW